jgi:hypothetical protein
MYLNISPQNKSLQRNDNKGTDSDTYVYYNIFYKVLNISDLREKYTQSLLWQQV